MNQQSLMSSFLILAATNLVGSTGWAQSGLSGDEREVGAVVVIERTTPIDLEACLLGYKIARTTVDTDSDGPRYIDNHGFCDVAVETQPGDALIAALDSPVRIALDASAFARVINLEAGYRIEFHRVPQFNRSKKALAWIRAHANAFAEQSARAYLTRPQLHRLLK